MARIRIPEFNLSKLVKTRKIMLIKTKYGQGVVTHTLIPSTHGGMGRDKLISATGVQREFQDYTKKPCLENQTNKKIKCVSPTTLKPT